MNLFEYTLTLSTNEIIDFMEVDPLRIREMSIPGVSEAASGVLKHCTSVAREAVEKAKKGYTKDLEKALRTPAIGCLLKMDKSICAEINHCVNANKTVCTTRNLTKNRRRADFPECWEYDMPEGPTEAKMLCTSIVKAWKTGRYVLFIN